MKKIVLVLGLIFSMAASVSATTLPTELTTYIRTQVPNVNVRFDGLITFPDKTTYLPLIPAIKNDVEKLEVVYSYPSKAASLNKKPEIMVFNNNYVLLKVIKEKNGVTVTKDENYPITVKTGVLPQDLLVPRGLYIPESLEGILGDLKIPVGKNNNMITKTEEVLQDEVTEFLDKENPVTVPKVNALKNKLFFISNYDSNYLRVINSNITQPLYSLKLESIPTSIIAVNDKYLMITTGAKTYVDVVDIQREEVAKQIDLTTEASEIVADKANNLAYIAAKNEEAIFIVDTKSMELKHKVLIKGYPSHMAISDDGTKLVYQDKNTARIYVVYPKEDYKTKRMVIVPNVSKLIATNNAVFAVSRTQNLLKVMLYPTSTLASESFDYPIDVHTVFDGERKYLPEPDENIILAQKQVVEKPVDMLLYKDKLFILGAKKNKINVYDTKTNEIIKTVDLPITGFSKKLTRIDNSNYVVISNAQEEKYLIFDLDTCSTIQQVPLNTRINNLVILKMAPTDNKPSKSKKEAL